MKNLLKVGITVGATALIGGIVALLVKKHSNDEEYVETEIQTEDDSNSDEEDE